MLFEQPVISIPRVSRDLNITYNAAKNNVKKLVEHGIISNVPGFGMRPTPFWAEGVIDILVS
jgi:hypothetical protein